MTFTVSGFRPGLLCSATLAKFFCVKTVLADLRVDGKDFLELPRTTLSEMHRAARDAAAANAAPPPVKLSDFLVGA